MVIFLICLFFFPFFSLSPTFCLLSIETSVFPCTLPWSWLAIQENSRFIFNLDIKTRQIQQFSEYYHFWFADWILLWNLVYP